MARSIATTRRNVRDYQHKLCRENLLRVRQQSTLAARLACIRRVGDGNVKHTRLAHL